MAIISTLLIFLFGVIVGIVGFILGILYFLDNKTKKLEKQSSVFPNLAPPKTILKQYPILTKVTDQFKTSSFRTSSISEIQSRKLLLEIIEGDGILASDHNGTSADSFLKIKLGGQRLKTRIIPKSLSPKWDEHFVLQVDNPQSDKLEIQLFDDDKPKEPLGEVIIVLADLLKDQMKEHWLPLQGKVNTKQGKLNAQGELRLKLTLVDANIDLPLSVKPKKDKKEKQPKETKDERKKEKEEKKEKRERRQEKSEKVSPYKMKLFAQYHFLLFLKLCSSWPYYVN